MTTSATLDPTSADEGRAATPTLLQRAVARWQSPTFRQAFLSVADQAVVSGTSFASSVLVGRSCSQDQLGVYALVLSMLLLARGIQGDLISGPYLVYCHHRNREALARYTGSSLIHQTILSLGVLFALMGLAAGMAFAGSSTGLASAVLSLALVTPLVLLREHLRQLSFAHLRLREALAIDILVAMMQLGAVGLLAWTGALTVTAIYVSMGAGCGVACLGWLIARPDAVSFRLADAWSDWWSNWQFGRWSLASQLISRAMTYLAPWLIAWTHGEAATGLLAANVTIVNLAGMFVTGVSNALTPHAARAYVGGGVTRLRTVLFETLTIFLVTVGGFCGFVALTGDGLITFVYGDRFAGAPFVLLLLALQLLANSIGIVVGNGLWAMNRPEANFRADVMTLLVSSGILALAIPTAGITGAAFGLLLGTAAGTLIRIAVLLQIWRNAPLQRDIAAWEATP
ncbi:MAG: lipopolysaccharide biosynthesis protein [Planctomycetaceae bacterium]|nr:lipopolysaccharide biosynthesis protein [Planctomycetaceae bacterium]